jgi:hypothetical protein
MLKSETAILLAFAQGIDGRDFSEQSVEAWHEVIGDLEFDTAMAAAKRHYKEESRRLFPADILKNWGVKVDWMNRP